MEHSSPAGDSPSGQATAEGDDSHVAITVGFTEEGLYVADDGPGIPERERQSVFESGYSTSSDGTGFGLSIVEDVVEAHGWDIAVTESEAGGARFDITGVDWTRPPG